MKKYTTSAEIVETEFVKNDSGDDDDLKIVGRASTSSIDRAGHVVDMDSLKAAMDEKFTTRSLLWQHNKDAPIGTVQKWWFEDDCCWVEGAISNGWSVPVSRNSAARIHLSEIREMVKRGAVRSYSIGFGAEPQRSEKSDGPTTLIVKDFYECSVVTLPANPHTVFGVANSFDDDEVAFDVRVVDNEVVASVVVNGVTYTSRHSLAIAKPVERQTEVERDFDEAELRVLEECVETIRSAQGELSGAGDEANEALASILRDVEGIGECQRQRN